MAGENDCQAFACLGIEIRLIGDKFTDIRVYLISEIYVKQIAIQLLVSEMYGANILASDYDFFR